MIDTPAILIDTHVMRENIVAMAENAAAAGVGLRPHVKTHKIPELAALQIEAGARGVTVAKVSEAEVMAAAGIRDIFIAYPLIPDTKIGRALDLARRVRVVLAVDSEEGARRLSAMADARGLRALVRLEIETGLRRTGVAVADALPFARRLVSLPGIELEGIFTFRGSILEGTPTTDCTAAGLDEGQRMADLAESLRREGIPVGEVSVGSTPTAGSAATIAGVTEIRPGTYIFNDRMQVAFGVCTLKSCAASVLVTVVSRPADDYVVVDGGSKCFATDVQPGTGPLDLRGFGEVVGNPDAILVRMSEEHGIVSVRRDHPFRVGDRLRIIPNHICPTVNLHSSLYLTESPEAVLRGDDGASIREVRVAARGMLA